MKLNLRTYEKRDSGGQRLLSLMGALSAYLNDSSEEGGGTFSESGPKSRQITSRRNPGFTHIPL